MGLNGQMVILRNRRQRVNTDVTFAATVARTMFRTQLVKRRAVDLCRVGSCLCRLS
ncbi:MULTISPECIES: putative leader peptide [unclassified Frankia]|uniref:putative leader peptide n=1 Tax=unclassified Frankia TaxID=2632575 RepID=UPI00351D0852